MLAEGQQLSHYTLMHLLRNGGMGEVYLAQDTLLKRQVAIKIINTDTLRYAGTDAAQDAARLFLREAQAIAQLDHSNILPLYDSGEQIVNGTTLMYMVMPYRQAGSMADWKNSHFGNRLLPLAAVERIVEQAALALQHAHDRHIIHQDVKPSNFLVQAEANHPGELHLQLADFGVARVMMTSESQVIRGTPTYMAPEQWDGRPVPATDQYALAVLAYEFLTGSPPFVGQNYQQMWNQHVHVDPSPPSTINPLLPRELDAVFLRALQKNPARRYSSVLTFAQAFQQAVLQSGNVRQTLIISPLEARTGTNRVILIHNGRQVIVPIPAGVSHGQIILLEGYGRSTTYNNPVGALIVTIHIAPVFDMEAAPPSTPTFQLTIPAFNSVAPKSMKPALPSVPLNKRRIKNSNILRRAMIAVACVLLLSSVPIGYFMNTKYNTPPLESNHNFPSYIHEPRNGTFALFDALEMENKNLGWVLPLGVCSFVNRALIVTIKRDDATPQHFHNCMMLTHTFTNFAYEVTMKLNTINPGDCGGVSVRNNPQTESQLYYFYICGDGSYGFVRYEGNNDTKENRTLVESSSSLITPGPGHTYILAVVAQGFNFDLYVNHKYITTVIDPNHSFKYGTIGVLVRSTDTGTIQVSFSDATVWKL
jgi:serine/threonine protein kinase